MGYALPPVTTINHFDLLGLDKKLNMLLEMCVMLLCLQIR